jgi:hypothetical protein
MKIAAGIGSVGVGLRCNVTGVPRFVWTIARMRTASVPSVDLTSREADDDPSQEERRAGGLAP